MSPAKRQHLHTLVARQRERAEIREALQVSAARSSIDRMLGEELIAAGQEVVAAWDDRSNSQTRIRNAVERMRDLVGARRS